MWECECYGHGHGDICQCMRMNIWFVLPREKYNDDKKKKKESQARSCERALVFASDNLAMHDV